ncbi:MAG: methyl-accepting chemotaxis protein, partial [Verrucomicrobiales bacterium]
MSVRSTFVSIFVGFAALLGCLVFVAYLSAQNQKAVEDSEARRFASYQLADELRQSSDDLTRFARSYVVTGDPVFERHFFDVLAIRSGEKPRPENYGGIYWDFVLATGEKPAPDGPPASLHSLMRKMRFTDAEFRKLAESEANSNALVQLEEQSMNAIKESSSDQAGAPGSGGDAGAEAARQMMFGKDYHVAKAAIMKPLDEFLTMLDERTALEVAALHRKGRIYGVVALGLTGAGLLFTLGAFVGLDRRVQKSVRLLAAAAKRVEAGDYG